MSELSKTTPVASYSTAFVAKRLGVSVPTVQRWVDAGQLKAWKTLGGHRRIDAASAERLFREHATHGLQRMQGAPPAAPAVSAVPAESVSVMVVDDNPLDRELIVELVKHALPGSTVAAYENGIQALVAIGLSVPTVVITDIQMPYMNGTEMLRQLASKCLVRPRLIVAVSGQPARDLPDDVKWLRKPLEAQPLTAWLQDAAPAPQPTKPDPLPT